MSGSPVSHSAVDNWLRSHGPWQQSWSESSESVRSTIIDSIDTTTDGFFKIFFQQGDLSSTNTLSISTIFFAGSDLDPNPSDIVFFTTDYVYYWVHSSKFFKHSKHSCCGMLTDLSTSLPLPETSEIANLAFHMLYHFNFPFYSPTLSLVVRALSLLALYGIDISSVLVPSNPLYNTVLYIGVRYPLETYTVAAGFNLETLAIEISKHLLTTPLCAITDEMARVMGPHYLRRLVFLHMGRTERLKELIMQPPPPHDVTKDCYETDQKHLQQEWRALALALGCNAGPSTSTSQLYNTFLPITQKETLCPKCSEVSNRHVPLTCHSTHTFSVRQEQAQVPCS
jgi:hypothetical protein